MFKEHMIESISWLWTKKEKVGKFNPKSPRDTGNMDLAIPELSSAEVRSNTFNVTLYDDDLHIWKKFEGCTSVAHTIYKVTFYDSYGLFQKWDAPYISIEEQP